MATFRFAGKMRLVLIGAALMSSLFAARAEAPRALPTGVRPDDIRLEPLKDLDGYFPFHPPSNRAEWAQRAQQVRTQMRVALGLWPMPTKRPLHAVIHGRFNGPGYSIEKVCFESFPGFYVTGNLYRPLGRAGKLPGVLCPHGHWENGRFTDCGPERIREQLAHGEERFEDGGRNPLESRCVQLARMGCVVFHYDMIGYADSQQISEALAHGFSQQRPEMNTRENWGLFSPQAEAHLESVMALQTFDSIRALDFLLSLPEVDPARIGVTGASGGGTQTFILGAIDPRPAVIFPAVMVSTAMQGGCTCENACDLRVGAGNVEFAALFAPKPLGMTCANDWTKEMPTKGYPQLQQLYAMLGAPANVKLTALLQFGHNYNYVSRAAMYSWMNQHLHLGWSDPIVEEDYPRLTGEQLTVWDARHPKPPGGPDFERRLLAWITQDAARQLRAHEQNWEDFRQTFAPAAAALLLRPYAQAGAVVWDIKQKNDRDAYIEMAGLLRNTTRHEELPAIFLYPKQWNGETILWLNPEGKAGLYDAGGQVKPEILQLVQSGATVAGIDLFDQGEFLADGAALKRTPTVKNPREFAAYTFGYNPSVFAERVHDILTAVTFVRHFDERPSKIVALAGMGPGIGALAAAARSQAGAAVDRAAIDTGGFRFGRLLDYRDPNFLPGGAKYEDLLGFLALGAPHETWLAGESQSSADWVKGMYELAGGESALAVYTGDKEGEMAAAARWLLRPAQ